MTATFIHARITMSPNLILSRCLMKQSTAVIQLEVQRPVCLELYQDCKDLGRFMLRSKGNTIAAGMVTKVGEYASFNVGSVLLLHN